MVAEPLFYQQVSLYIFSKLLKELVPTTEGGTLDDVAMLTYEEENAVRYMGGYLVRVLTKENKDSSEITLQLKDLQNEDDDTEPAESEEWICSIDRGGLIRITDEMYQTLIAIEYVTHTFFNKSCVDKMDSSYRQKVNGSYHGCERCAVSLGPCFITNG